MITATHIHGNYEEGNELKVIVTTYWQKYSTLLCNQAFIVVTHDMDIAQIADVTYRMTDGILINKV